MKADEVYAKLKKMIGLVSVGMKNTTSTQNPDGSVTITINFTSGSPLSFTMAPVKGDKGVGIKDVQIKEIQNGENTEYHLILIDDKDNNIDAGNIPIPDITNLATKSDLTTHTSDTNIHITTAERNKWNEVDNISQALKTTQSLEYEGESATCNNTLASRTFGMLIKGKTYQNASKIESAGEKENKISILSHNKNFVNPNKLFLNNSSIIKENGVFICPPDVSWQSEKIMGVDLSKPLYFAYEIKSDENIIIDKTNQNMLIRLDYGKTGANIGQTNIPIGSKITNEYTKFIFKNISLSNTDGEQRIVLVFRNGVGKKIYIRNITISNAPIDDVIPYQQDKKEILLPIEGGLKSLSNGVADTIEQRNDGVYLVQRVCKVVLNGSETWTKSSWSMTNTFKFDFEIGLVAKLFDTNATNQILCDTFKVVSRNSLDNVANREFENICPSNSRSRSLSITISKTKLNDTNTTVAFRQWLSNNPVTVCYELETPIETKLDINNLGLEVYKDTTYVTTDNAIQPTLSFKVPSNIGGMVQANAQNINKIYKLIDEVIIPQLINNSADIEMLKLK